MQHELGLSQRLSRWMLARVDHEDLRFASARESRSSLMEFHIKDAIQKCGVGAPVWPGGGNTKLRTSTNSSPLPCCERAACQNSQGQHFRDHVFLKHLVDSPVALIFLFYETHEQ